MAFSSPIYGLGKYKKVIPETDKKYEIRNTIKPWMHFEGHP